MILLMNVDNENPSEIEGTNTQIEGAGILDFELKGNTHQDSYTGKNLFDISTITEIFNGSISDGVITIASNRTNSTIKFTRLSLPAGTYYISADIKKVEGEKTFINLNDGENIYNNVINPTLSTSYQRYQTSHTYSSSKSLEQIFANFSNSTGAINIKNIMISTSSDSSYEPFVGGSPSPSPDYPQPIEVVTGDNTIKVTGKNLAYTGWASDFVNRVNDSTKAKLETYDGKNCLAFMPSAGNNDYDNKYMFKPIGGFKENTQYTFKIDKYSSSSFGDMDIVYTDGSINEIAGLTANSWNSIVKTSTANKTIKYLRQRWRNNDWQYIDLDTFMVYEGTISTEYQPYQSKDYEISLGNIELCKIGDYQDYIYKENNKWYKHSEIGKVDFGNISWDSAGHQEPNYNRYYTNTISNVKYVSLNTQLGVGLCEKYKIHTGTGMSGYGSKNCFAIDVSMVQVADKTTPTGLFYYALNTPTNEEITDTDLIEQLEAISNSALFDGVNYIDLISDNLIGSYKITYSTWYQFEKILRSGYNINEDNDRITQKFANGHRKQFVSDYKDCIITLNLDTIDIDTTKEYLRQLKSGPYKYYSLENKEYKTAQFIIEKKPELKVNNSIGDNTDIDEYQVTLLRAGD